MPPENAPPVIMFATKQPGPDQKAATGTGTTNRTASTAAGTTLQILALRIPATPRRFVCPASLFV